SAAPRRSPLSASNGARQAVTTAPAQNGTGRESESGPLARRIARRLALLGYPLIALGYIATGRLGLLLAVPPGFATAIFPPSGIAATAMLVGGWASLPWTFLGSLALNLWIGWAAAGASPTVVLFAALLIASASTVQAALAGWVLRRAIGYPTALDNGAQLRAFLLLSPLCCLTSASLSVSGLWALGVLSEAELATSWLVWWVGDTLGVLIMLPLLL